MLRTVFEQLKRYIATAMDGWMRSNPGKCLTIYNILSIVKEAWPKATILSNIIQGFEVFGIYPFNQQIFIEADFAPSFVMDRPLSDSTASDKPGKETSSELHSDNSAVVERSQTSQEIDDWNMIDTALRNKALELIHIREDGHCLLNAFLKSLRSEGLGEITFEQICQNVKDEAEKYTEYYQRFETEGHTLKNDIGNY